MQNDGSLKEVFTEAELKKLAAVIKYLMEHDSITTKNVEKITGKSNSTAYRYLKLLESKKILQAEGNTDNSRYVRINRHYCGLSSRDILK